MATTLEIKKTVQDMLLAYLKNQSAKTPLFPQAQLTAAGEEFNQLVYDSLAAAERPPLPQSIPLGPYFTSTPASAIASLQSPTFFDSLKAEVAKLGSAYTTELNTVLARLSQ